MASPKFQIGNKLRVGISPWNKGKKTGFAPWLGKKRSEEDKKKMSEAKLGKPSNNPFKFKKGNVPWNKGKKRPDMTGKNHPNWKGGYENTIMLGRKRRILKFQAEGFHNLGEWETLKAQHNWTCPSCKRKEPEIKLTEDHIIPLSKGGSNNIENIQPLCRSCNSSKKVKIIKYGI